MKQHFRSVFLCLAVTSSIGLIPSQAENTGNKGNVVQEQTQKATQGLKNSAKKESNKRAAAQKLSNEEAMRQARRRDPNTPTKTDDNSPIYDRDTNRAIDRSQNPTQIQNNQK